MDALAAQTCDVVLALLVPAVLFGIVALVVRRRAAFARLCEVRRGTPTNLALVATAHRLHHIDDERLMDQNFGGFFTLWDRLFGTFDDASGHLGCRTGIAGGSRPLLGELARPVEALLGQAKREPAAPAA